MARHRLTQQRQQFLGEPLNLLYPYFAGMLICASQLKIMHLAYKEYRL